MALICDATALVALGKIDSIHLLRHVDLEVVLSPWVRERELRRFTSQVDLGIAEGWLRVHEPSTTDVRGLIEVARDAYRLDRGEAETLIVAGDQTNKPTIVLIDEDEAFRFTRNVLIGRSATRNWSLVCLAEILHQLEAGGNIHSASGMMQRLLDGDHYHWSPTAWAHYAGICEQRGLSPVPSTANRT